jgi:adenylylsulfate kinase-like enzyme
MKKKNGKIFWITGLSGSGKSTVGEKLKTLIKNKYSNTIIIHGDDIRNIYKFKFYSRIKRLKLGKANSDLCKLLSEQGLNVIFTTVGLFHELFAYNRKNLKNYLEIYIKTDIKKLLKNKNKSFYKIRTKNIWGLDLKPQFPKNSEIIIENNFDKSAAKLAKIIYEKIEKE